MCMTNERTFTCGHSAPEPLYFGRGAARERRLADYFAHKCEACLARDIRAAVELLTDTHGNRLPADRIEAIAAERINKAMRRYVGPSR